MNALSPEVTAGVALLDRVNPGWYAHIHTDVLNISDVDACVLGQLYGTYRHGLVAIGLYDTADHLGHKYGFNVDRGSIPGGWMSVTEWHQRCRTLEDEWVSVVHAKVAQSNADARRVREALRDEVSVG